MYGIRAEGTESTDAELNHSFLGRKQAGLSLSSLLLSILNTFPSTLAEDHLHTLLGHPGPAQLLATLDSLCTVLVGWRCCRRVERLQGPPVPRLNVAAQTAELTKGKRSVAGLAVVGWSLLHTAPGRKQWTLTEMSWVPWLRWNSSPRW